MDFFVVYFYYLFLYWTLEIPNFRVFCGANAQLLWTSKAGTRMLLKMLHNQDSNWIHVALLHLAQHQASWTECTNPRPLFWSFLATKVNTNQPMFKGPLSMTSFVFVYWVWILTSQSIYVAKSKCWPLWPLSAIKVKCKDFWLEPFLYLYIYAQTLNF